MSKLRQAILQAADWIEKNPGKFQFMQFSKPSGCGSPGCALGWIGYFAKSKADGAIGIAEEVLKIPKCGYGPDREGAQPFYARLDDIHGNGDWKHSGRECASALRLYADKYHPAEPLKIERASGAEICRAIITKPLKEVA